MKLSKEMEVWIKQQHSRKKSCENSIKDLMYSINVHKSRIKLLREEVGLLSATIELEKEQIKCIEKDTQKAISEWDDKREVNK